MTRISQAPRANFADPDLQKYVKKTALDLNELQVYKAKQSDMVQAQADITAAQGSITTLQAALTALAALLASLIPSIKKLSPMDFREFAAGDISARDGLGRTATIASAKSGFWSFEIPAGLKITSVTINGNLANGTYAIYKGEINDNSTATSLGSGTLSGTSNVIDITDVAASATNYCTIVVARGTSSGIVWGASVALSLA